MNKRILKKTSSALYLTILVFCMAALVVFPERYVRTAADGIKIWAITVLPSLLPFFFLTALITKTGTIGRLSRLATPFTRLLYGESGISAYLQIMSFLSGYPVGAKLVADLYEGGVIDESSATHLALLSSTSGPLFIVGGIGVGMFSNATAGYAILLSHCLSSVFVGIVFRPRKKRVFISAPPLTDKKSENVLYESVYSSVVSIAVVGAFISVFYTFARILADAKILSPVVSVLSPVFGKGVAEGLAIGLIECTTGITAIAKISSGATAIGLAAFLVTFGGLSVWCQSLIYLGRAHANVKTFAAAKLVQAAISFPLCYLICSILKI